MKLRNLSLIICGSLLFIGVLNFYFNFFRFPFLNVSLFEAIPEQSALVIECHDVEKLNKLALNSPLWGSIQKTSLFKKIQLDFDEVINRFLINEDSTLSFHSDQIIAALQMSSAKSADFLYIIDSGGKQFNPETFLEKIEDIKVNKSVFLKEIVYEIIFADNQRFTFSFYKNIILLARFPFMVEGAIAQLNKPRKSINKQKDFQLVKKSESGGSEVTIYFNLKRIPQLLNHSGQNKGLAFLKQMESLLTLNIHAEDNDVSIDGAFVSDSNTEFKTGTIKPSESEMYKVIPDNCSFLFWQSKIHEKSQLPLELESADFTKYLEPWIGEEFAVFLTESRKISISEEQFFVFKVKDTELTEQLLTEYAESKGKLQKIDYQTFTINQLFSGEFLSPMSLLDKEGLQSPFYTIIEDFIIFSGSRQSLEILIDKHILGQTLSNDASFLQFHGGLMQTSNTFFYCNTSLVIPFLRHFSAELGQEHIDAFFDILYNFKTLGVQLDRSKKISNLDIYLNESESHSTATKIIWTANLKANAIIPPAVLKNNQNQQNEIFVQDAENGIYLLDRNGKLLWERPLKSPILSKIFQIDYYGDDKNQILFNTKDHIYLIDHKGKDIKAFPLDLPVPASNGLCIIDFENNKNYTFFIGAQNGSVYAFKKTGAPLEGWNPKENVGKLIHDIQHFQLAGNDYILALNDIGDFHVFKRNGENRFEPVSFNSKYLSPPGFQTFKKNARIVLANQNGKAQVFNLKGKHFNLYVGSGNDKNTQFLFADVIGDDRKDYITLNGRDLSCYYYEKSDFKKAFSLQFEHDQNELFAVQIGDNKNWEIGTLNFINKRINLLKNDGSLANGFPLSATTKFSIVDLFETDTKVLITALENSIYACKID